MRFVLIIGFLLTAACAKGTPSDGSLIASCADYPSPYMIEYPDGEILKSEVSQCGTEFTAKTLDQSGRTLTSGSLTIQLKDAKTGTPYLTSFQGQ